MAQEKIDQIKTKVRRAARIEWLKQNKLDQTANTKIQSDIKSKLATVNKLQIVFKIPKKNRLDTKNLLNDVK